MSKPGKSISIIAMCLFMFNACSQKPKDFTVVTSFDLNKYMGKWYEIARLDFKFERNLNNVTATYSINEGGTVKVDNRGYNYKTKEWKKAVGKAKLAGKPSEGKLKVSFFGPFYSAYNIISLDDEYNYALVIGKNLDYLWILSRKTVIPPVIKETYLKTARDLGYNIDNLIWTEHSAIK